MMMFMVMKGRQRVKATYSWVHTKSEGEKGMGGEARKRKWRRNKRREDDEHDQI